MTLPDDPDVSTRSRGESARAGVPGTNPAEPDEPISKTRGEDPRAEHRPNRPGDPRWPDPDDYETKERGEAPWAPTVTLSEPSPGPEPDETALRITGSARRPRPAPPQPQPPDTFVRGEVADAGAPDADARGAGVIPLPATPLTLLGALAARQGAR